MEEAEFRRGWPVVLACFVVAVFAWGFAFYGQAVYLAELQRINGWSASLISSATTLHYLSGAVFLTVVHLISERIGVRALLVCAALVLGAGAIGISRSSQPWQLYASCIVLAAGWAGTSLTAISTTLSRWFNRRRGLAISLALNGASVSGFTVAPGLVYLSEAHGLASAVLWTVVGLLAVLLPLVIVALRDEPAALPAPISIDREGAPNLAAPQGTREALRIPGFWTIAAPFALSLTAQVGFIVHQVAFLLPTLGSAGTGIAIGLGSLAAVVGRVGLGFFIDRLDQRQAAAISVLSQSAALVGMVLWPTQPAALYGGSILFGLSVGNLITLPPLILQREFAAHSFAMLVGLANAIAQVTYAIGPGLLGILRDVTGSYTVPLLLCVVLQIAAAVIVVLGRHSFRQS